MAATAPHEPVVLLTGASRGIGSAIAAALAQRHARVALVYGGSKEAAEETLAALHAPDRHRLFQCDVADPAACEALVADVVAWAGRLDVLINNAGVSVDNDDWLGDDVSYDDWQAAWRRTMAVNYEAPCNLSYLAVRQFRKQDFSRDAPSTDGAGPRERGRIVNVSSRGAYCGDPTAPAYAASKSALNVFHNATAKQIAAEGIFVFTVAPGATETAMWTSVASPQTLQAMAANHPLGRLNQPSEIAAIAAYLSFDAPPTMTGNITDANGAIYMR